MSQSANQVLARVEAEWLKETAEPLVARWVECNNGRSIKRQKQKGNRQERTEKKADGTWILKKSKVEGGRWVADDQVIIPIQLMVEKVYEEWLAARSTKDVEDFSRAFGNTYEGTRLKDTKFIIRHIKIVEAELNPKPVTKLNTKSKSKRTRKPSLNIDEVAAATSADPVFTSNADSECPSCKRATQSMATDEVPSEDTPEKFAIKMPTPIQPTQSPQNTAIPETCAPILYETPAVIQSYASAETPTTSEQSRTVPLKPVDAPTAKVTGPSSRRRDTAKYITKGEVTMTKEIDENGNTIITYDHSDQRTFKVMSGSLIGIPASPAEPKTISTLVGDLNSTLNRPKGPRRGDFYRPNAPRSKY